MDLFILESVVDGFLDGEFDITSVFVRDPAKLADLSATIIANIIDVLNSPNAGAALSIAGHAGRDDTPGRSHIDHLAVESNASEERASSALAFIQTTVQQLDPSAPADLNTLAFFDVHVRAPGAGVLVNSDAFLTEAQQQQNRRVQVRLLVFKP